MNLLITYDLDNGHEEVKNYLLAAGYSEEISKNNKKMRLPNTTLWGDKLSSQAVSLDFKNACNAYNRSCRYEKDKIKNSSHFVVMIDFSEFWMETV